MSSMKVLFVGGGRRVSLAKRFSKAGFSVFAYETDINCPIAEIAQIIDGKRWADPNLKKHLLEICQKYNIKVLIPLQDAATTILSQMKEDLQAIGSFVPTSSEATNEFCLNKSVFHNKLVGSIIYPSPSGDLNEKVIMKPIFGFNSKGLVVTDYKSYLDNKIENDSKYVVQAYVENGQEISVDAYFNRQGKMIDAVPRLRQEVQGGEVSRSKTLPRDSYGVVDWVRQIGEEHGVVGPTCCQFIISPDGKPFIMEINARFGGGVILSLEAGLNMISLIKREYVQNHQIEPMKYNWRENFSMVRYFKEHFYA